MFKHDRDVKQDHMQSSRFISSQIDVITLYRSQDCNLAFMNQNIGDMIETGKPQLVVGDFNFCYLESSSNFTSKYLHFNNFKQLITEPTHLEGNLLDQAHFRDIEEDLQCQVKLHSKYYTDHKGVAIIVKKS